MTSHLDVLPSFMKGQSDDREQLVEDDGIDKSIENHATKVSELQLESSQRCQKHHSQEGLKVVIITSICFAVSVTVALIITIYVGPPQVPSHAGVVSDSKDCSDVGAKLLMNGGSAVDAVVATSLCVGFVNPQASGIGGGGMMVVHRQRTGDSIVIDFMGSMPEHWGGFTTGKSGQAVNVPGMLRGLEVAHRKFGKLPWKKVILSVKDFISQQNVSAAHTAVELQIFAQFLVTLADEGSKVFYEGEVADELIDLINTEGGFMSLSDFKRYQPVVTEPIKSSFMDVTVETTPAPSDGPLLLLMLNILGNITADSSVANNSTQLFHYIVEAMKFTYAERSGLVDPKTFHLVENITQQIISKEYAGQIALLINPNTTQPTEYYLLHNTEPSELTNQPMATSHVSVIGPADDIVSVTLSLNEVNGSGIRTPSGFYLNNQLKAHNKALTPSIVYNTDSPCAQRFAVGAGHGVYTAAAVAEVILNIVRKNKELSEAISAGRLYANLLSDSITVEASLPLEILTLLKSKGHSTFTTVSNDVLKVNVASKTNELVSGFADRRNAAGGDSVY